VYQKVVELEESNMEPLQELTLKLLDISAFSAPHISKCSLVPRLSVGPGYEARE